MAFGTHNTTTMIRVEVDQVNAKKRWKLEDGPVAPAGYVVFVPPERGTNANGVPI